MSKILLIVVIAALSSGCAAVRATTAKTLSDLDDLSVCTDKRDLAKKIGGVDDTIAVPGGGRIDVYNVMVRNPNTGYGPVGAWLVSLSTLGMMDMTIGAVDALEECSDTSRDTGVGAKCDFKALRYYVHYADARSSQASCMEKTELWAGATFSVVGDESKCPIEYKDTLAALIDTSEFPEATLSWPGANGLTVQEQLTAMADSNRRNCK